MPVCFPFEVGEKKLQESCIWSFNMWTSSGRMFLPMPTSVPANFSTVAVSGDQNNTNSTRCPQAEMNDWHTTVLPVYILLISVLGIVLNVFVLMVFCLHKKACTVSEIYLSNMAAADLILMACLPFWAVYAAKKFNWPFDNSLCRLVTLSISMNANCSIYFLVLISIDRYVVLVHPLSHGGLRRTKYAKLACLLVWCLGLLLNVPTLVYRQVRYFSAFNANICFVNYPNKNVQLLLDVMHTTMGFIIPIAIISFCTLKIIQALNNRLINRLNTQKVEQKANALILAVLLAFMICWMPFYLVKIVKLLLVVTECSTVAILNICQHVVMYMAFFNSALNPILYIIVGKNFQKKVREIFKRWSADRTTSLNTTFTRQTGRSVEMDVSS